MKTNSKESEKLLGSIEGFYGKIHRLLKWLCITFVTLFLGFLVWMNVSYAKMGDEDNINYLIMSYLLFFAIVAIFVISFYFLKNAKRKKIRKFKYFMDNPDTLISYNIITGDVTKLILIVESNKVTFPLELSPIEIEELLLKIIPDWQKNKERRESESKTLIINEFQAQPQPQKVDKLILMQDIPTDLKVFFKEKFTPKLGCLPYIFGIFLIATIMSLIGRFGWYDFGFFEVGNSYWFMFLLPLILFGIGILFSKSEDRKIHDLLKNPENVIWIYLKKTKSTGILPSTTTTTLVIADVKKRHEVSLFKKKEETLMWLSQYCPSAVVGFYYEWDEIYNKNPNDFLKLIHDKQ